MKLEPTNKGQGGLLPHVPFTRNEPANFYQSSFPLIFTLLDGVTAVTAPDDEADVLGRNYHAIQVAETSDTTFNATVLVEGTLDGVNWAQIDSITAVGIKQYSGLYQSIRASVTAYTSGTITVSSISQRS